MTGDRGLRLTRRGRALVTLAVTVLLVALAAVLVVRTPLGTVLGLSTGPPCAVTAADTTSSGRSSRP